MAKPKLSLTDEDLLKLETRNSAGASLPEGEELNLEVYKAFIREWDGKRCEAMILSEDSAVHPLLKARALMLRGRFDEAEAALKGVANPAETGLERARAAAFRGNWADALAFCERALTSEPPPVTRLTLFQVRAIANFELGHFSVSMQDLLRIDSMKEILPNANSVVYAKVLEARIRARTQSVVAAETLLELLWTDLIGREALNRDNLLALLRAEIDLARLAGRPCADLAHAGYLLAESMGDRLYASLAILDYCFALRPEARERTLARHAQEIAEFERSRSLLEELRTPGRLLASTTGSAMRSCAGSADGSPSCGLTQPVLHIVLARRSIVIHLKPFSIIHSPGQPQLFKAITMLRRIACDPDATLSATKEDFFKAVWGHGTFCKERHDPSIWMLLRRLRTELGLDATIQDGLVRLKQILVLNSG